MQVKMRWIYLVLYGCDKSDKSAGFGAMQLEMSKKTEILSKKFVKELIHKIQQSQSVTGVWIDSVRLLRTEKVDG